MSLHAMSDSLLDDNSNLSVEHEADAEVETGGPAEDFVDSNAARTTLLEYFGLT